MKFRKRIRKVFSGKRSKTIPERSETLTVADTSQPEKSDEVVNIGVFTQKMLDLHSISAKRYGVEPTVHAADFMYWFHVGNACHPSVDTPIRYYFDDGSVSAHKLAAIIKSEGLGGEEKLKLLEFASGYGMVTRHLKRYPHLALVCSDIHQEAIDFLQNTLGVGAFLSSSRPEEFQSEEKFDVTFALSFFTHMPKASFGRWIGALYQTLKPGGRLIFTTHGYATLADMPGAEIPPDGVLFFPSSEQKDLDPEEYGVTIVKPEYVMAQIMENTSSKQVTYKHAGWWTKQDIWIVHCA